MVSVLISGIVLYSAVTAYVFFFQSSFLYFPDNKIQATPQQRGISYKEVAFATEDGVELNGWFIPSQNSENVLLFCHGNAGNISHRLDSIEIFHNMGLSILIFDYRGYGKSEGVPSEEGTYRDAEAAWKYLVGTEHFDASQIILFGRSLGGSIAAKLSTMHSPKALIVESAFTSVVDLGTAIYPFLPVRLISTFSYNTLQYVSAQQSPVLVIHSSDDEIIPFAHGKAIFEAANAPKAFLEIRGSHNRGFVHSKAVYGKKIREFIANYE